MCPPESSARSVRRSRALPRPFLLLVLLVAGCSELEPLMTLDVGGRGVQETTVPAPTNAARTRLNSASRTGESVPVADTDVRRVLRSAIIEFATLGRPIDFSAIEPVTRAGRK